MVIHHPASQRPPHPTAWGMATGTWRGGGVGNLGELESKKRSRKYSKIKNQVEMRECSVWEDECCSLGQVTPKEGNSDLHRAYLVK